MSSALDIDAVAAFASAAELSSFTRAARALGCAQSQISMRIRKLEAGLGRPLLQRHPRLVRLTAEGERFLPAAHALLAAHSQALGAFEATGETLAIGLSEQAVGPDAAILLARLAAREPDLAVTLRIEPSARLEAAFEAGALDAVVLRRLAASGPGEVLRRDAMGWFAGPDLRPDPKRPLPLISLSDDCRLRAHALALLERAGLPVREAVVGGGMAAVVAALLGGLGVTPLARAIAPAGSVEIGDGFGLPPLGDSVVVLRSTAANPRGRALVSRLAALLAAPQPFGNSSPISR